MSVLGPQVLEPLQEPKFTGSRQRAGDGEAGVTQATDELRPGPRASNSHVSLSTSAFNVVLNFGIAVTYPTLMSLGIVLSVPVNAGESVRRPYLLVIGRCTHSQHTHVCTPAHMESCCAWCVLQAYPCVQTESTW